MQKQLVIIMAMILLVTLMFPLTVFADTGHGEQTAAVQNETAKIADGHKDAISAGNDPAGAGHEDENDVSQAATGETEDSHGAAADSHEEELDLAWTTNRILVVGGEAFVEELLNIILAILWMLLVALQLARPYILNLVQKFTLRLGADLWWLAYILIRDLVAVFTFVFSFFFFFPMLLAERAFPLFGAFSALLLFLSMIVRVLLDPDDDPKAFMTETNLLGMGAGLYLVSVIFGVQALKFGFAPGLSKFLVTSTNLTWATGLLWISMAGFAIAGFYFIAKVVADTFPKSETENRGA